MNLNSIMAYGLAFIAGLIVLVIGTMLFNRLNLSGAASSLFGFAIVLGATYLTVQGVLKYFPHRRRR